MEKKRLAYVTAAKRASAFAAGNVILSLRKYMPQYDFDVIVYYTELEITDKELFEQMENVILRKFEIPQFASDKLLPLFVHEEQSESIFDWTDVCRYVIFQLLDNYHSVVWIDPASAIQSCLYPPDSKSSISMVHDKHNTGVYSVGEYFSESIHGIDMNKGGFLTSVIFVNDTLENHKEVFDWLWQKTADYSQRIKFLENAIINLAIQVFAINVHCLTHDEFAASPTSEHANIASITHFGTMYKIWNSTQLIKAFPEWYRTHLMWVKLGGSDFNRRLIDTRNILFNSSIELKNTSKVIRIKFFWIPVLKINCTDQSVQGLLFNRIPIFAIKKKTTY